MTTITATDFQVAPRTAHDAVSLRRTRSTHRSPFSEVREARRQHVLQVAAVSTGSSPSPSPRPPRSSSPSPREHRSAHVRRRDDPAN